jgi:hypothetical protein
MRKGPYSTWNKKPIYSTDFTLTLIRTPKSVQIPCRKDQIPAQASEKETSQKQIRSGTDLEVVAQDFLVLVSLAMTRTENLK